MPGGEVAVSLAPAILRKSFRECFFESSPGGAEVSRSLTSSRGGIWIVISVLSVLSALLVLLSARELLRRAASARFHSCGGPVKQALLTAIPAPAPP